MLRLRLELSALLGVRSDDSARSEDLRFGAGLFVSTAGFDGLTSGAFGAGSPGAVP